MTEKELERHVAWVQENLSMLAMRGAEEMRRIVRQADDEVRDFQTTINIVAAIAGGTLGHIVSTSRVSGADRGWGYYALVIGCGMVCAVISTATSDSLLHAKIRRIDDACRDSSDGS